MNIESQEMKFHEWGVGVDPDESCWVESVKFNLSFLVVIRVFYELGPPACEEIGQFEHPLVSIDSVFRYWFTSLRDQLLLPTQFGCDHVVCGSFALIGNF